MRTQLPYEYYVLPFCNQGVDLNTQEALNLGEVRGALSIIHVAPGIPPQKKSLNPNHKAPLHLKPLFYKSTRDSTWSIDTYTFHTCWTSQRP